MDSQHALNAKTGKWGDASPVKEIIAQISGLVKTLDYSSLTISSGIFHAEADGTAQAGKCGVEKGECEATEGVGKEEPEYFEEFVSGRENDWTEQTCRGMSVGRWYR